MEYTIGFVAKKLNLTISQIRYYDKEGLLTSLKKVNGIRKFTDKDIDALYIIECLKKSGLEIKEIKQFMEWVKEGDSTIDTRLDFFKKQEEKIINKINQMQKILNLVKYKCWYYEKAKELNSVEKLEENIDNLTPLEIKKLLENSHC